MGKILIVDDSLESRELLKRILLKCGYSHIVVVSSAEEGFQVLNEGIAFLEFDLILLDVLMPGMDGIEACKTISSNEKYKDIPIIMVTGIDDSKALEQAFQAGAMDYIKKPYDHLELTARIRNALKLKQEMDIRKAREQDLLEVTQELKELNAVLEQLSNIDGLTGVANRRSFNRFFEAEWQRAIKTNEYLSIVLLDIDKFKIYNDTYGHQEGDDCLKKIATIIEDATKNSQSLVARYGGEEFVVVLPNTSLQKGLAIAEQIRLNVEEAKIVHENSPVSKHVTISAGVACTRPISNKIKRDELVCIADQGLYQSKRNGRNQTSAVQENSEGVVVL